MPGERQCLFGVAGSLVEAPGAEVDHSCAQNNERRSGVILATAELLDGTRDQWERLVRPACGRQGARNKELPAAVIMALNTGLRRGELLGLTWERVGNAV